MSPSSPSLPTQLEQIITQFQQISEPRKRYEYLLKLAQKVPPLLDIYKISENRVPGCISQVYVYGINLEGKINFLGDSDAQLTKGLLGLLITGLSGLTPEEIIQVKPDFIQEIGLNIRLTPSRSNGFYNIFQMMQKKALIHLRDWEE